MSSWESEHNSALNLNDSEEFVHRGIMKVRNWKLKMKTICFTLVLLGAVLLCFTSISPVLVLE